MGASYYDEELKKGFESKLKEEDFKILDSELFFEIINKKFPFNGGRIDFKQLNNYMFFDINNYNNVDIYNCIINIIDKNKIIMDEEIVYLGDNLTEKAYTFSLKYLKNIFSLLLEVPQHHYIINNRGEWCIYIAFENYIEFGKL